MTYSMFRMSESPPSVTATMDTRKNFPHAVPRSLLSPEYSMILLAPVSWEEESMA